MILFAFLVSTLLCYSLEGAFVTFADFHDGNRPAILTWLISSSQYDIIDTGLGRKSHNQFFGAVQAGSNIPLTLEFMPVKSFLK